MAAGMQVVAYVMLVVLYRLNITSTLQASDGSFGLCIVACVAGDI
jgi:hypothetical protein